MSSDRDLSAYYAEAATWDADRAAQSARSAKIAWIVASLAVLAALVASAAVMLLSPLKRVEPFVVRVDNSTGLVDVVPVYAGTAELPQAVTRYLLTHYVDVCERFSWTTAERDYQECGAFHSAARNQQWAALWVLSNPNSPLNLYKDGTEVSAHVVSVTFFQHATGTTDLAQVRYTKAKRTSDAGDEQVTHWIANVQFAYAKPSTDPSMRQWNPLGLRIVDFRTEQEVPAEKSATPPTSATSTAPLAPGMSVPSQGAP
jgi:type IV secretion system protein VirB8